MAADISTLRVKDDHLARVLVGEDFLIEDGAMGTVLQKLRLVEAGELPDLLNLTKPADIVGIHRAYVEAGAEMITTNTFNANAHKLGSVEKVREVYRAAERNAREAGARYVAGNIGPTGSLLEPLGTMSFDEAYSLFAEQARAASEAGCDLLTIETMADLRETKAAVLAACDETDLPVFVSMTFGEDGRTFLGSTPAVATAALSALGVAAIGVNCVVASEDVERIVCEMARFARCPVIARPNAGLPQIVDGETVYNADPADFARLMGTFVEAGASIVGGCCGTDPSFIEAVAASLAGARPTPRSFERAFVVTSAQEAVVLAPGSPQVAVIGERINPTGKAKLKEALRSANYDYVVGEAVAQQEAGADILDVNAGLPDLDEPRVLREVVEVLQGTVTAPLQIDSSDPAAIEAAVRGYAGKPLINSVNGKEESLAAVLPLARRYGCAVLGLTLDDEGIPATAEGRFAVAQRIVERADSQGIPRCDIAIDCLVMAAATNQKEIVEVLRAVSLVKQRLGVRTVLGVSNVSFGMPQRNLINATFLAAAFGAGLDMPIVNPLSARYRDVVETYRVLNGQDEGAVAFMGAYAGRPDPYDGPSAPPAGASVATASGSGACGGEGGGFNSAAGEGSCAIPIASCLADAADCVRSLVSCALSGRGPSVARRTKELLAGHEPLDVVNEVLVPVLDVVGQRYESGAFFLPQLMASAEAVKAGFDVVRDQVRAAGGADVARAGGGRVVVLATVEGDIHDIGKNIVKMLLENYGFDVVDLGRDVSPERVVEGARACGARLVGLSALMTTTVKAMERTIALLRDELPDVTVMVGGAVLTQDYADRMGASFYGADAAAATRIAARFFEENEV